MYLIRQVNLHAPQPVGVVDILMAGGKIIAIGPRLTPGIDGITEIDGSGRTALPGFIDQHVHITGGGGEGGFATRTPEFQLSTAVKAGVTTLCGLLGTDSFTRGAKSVVAKTKELKAGGLTCYCLTGAYQYPSVTVTGSVADDIVYIDEVIGCKLAISDHRCSHPTVQEILRLVSDIRMASLIAKKPSVLHIHVGAGKRGIEDIFEILRTTDIPIAHFRPTHMEGHADQAETFMEMGGYADITANPDKAEDFYKLAQKAPKGRLTLSSDAGGSIPKWNEKREIIGIGVGGMDTLYTVVRLMTEQYGMPMEQALSYITTNVANALNLAPHKGTVQPGSDADLVLVDSNKEIDSVFAGGQAMMLEKKDIKKGIFEQ